MCAAAFARYPLLMQLIPLPDHGQILLVVTPYVGGEAIFDLTARLALVKDGLEVIDGGNTFNAYRAVQALRRHAPLAAPANPARALERVRLSRVFTCYQMAALLETLEAAPPPRLPLSPAQQPRPVTSLEEPGGGQAGWPLLVFDLLATFGDQSVPVRERRRLLRYCLARLKCLAQSGRPLGIWLRVREVVPPEVLEFQARVEASAARIWRLEPRLPAPPRQPGLF